MNGSVKILTSALIKEKTEPHSRWSIPMAFSQCICLFKYDRKGTRNHKELNGLQTRRARS